MAQDPGLLRHFEQHIKFQVPQHERGVHLASFVAPAAAAGLRRFILASKAGRWPQRQTQDFHWVACFPASADDEVVAAVDSGSWSFGSPEVHLCFGVLAEGEPEPRLPPEVGEFSCVEFSLRPRSAGLAAAAAAADGMLTGATAEGGGGADAPPPRLAFVPERLELPAEVQPAYVAYYAAFDGIDGYDISYQATCSLSSASTALTYGEAHFLPTYRLLSRLGAGRGETLVDLGSGTGRFLLAASLGFPTLRLCWGIEVIPALHEAAVAAHAKASGGAPVELSLGDFRDFDWSEATILVVMTLCFPEASGSEQKPFRPVALRDVEPRHAVATEMSFGETQLYVFERAGGDGFSLDALD